MLQAYRRNTGRELPEITKSLSNAQRLAVIERLEDSIAYFTFLKRSHALKLYMDNNVAQHDIRDTFVVNTHETMSAIPNHRFGNPIHVAESKVTKSLMEEILSLNTDVYRVFFLNFQSTFNTIGYGCRAASKAGVVVGRCNLPDASCSI